jgi:hypothetical protein
MADQPPPTPSTVWAYAYQILPPQPERLLDSLMTLLDRERTEAQLFARTWQGRFVLERQVTHILVVSDNPELDIEANRRMEAELLRLNVGFALTAPLAVRDEVAVIDGPLDRDLQLQQPEL